MRANGLLDHVLERLPVTQWSKIQMVYLSHTEL